MPRGHGRVALTMRADRKLSVKVFFPLSFFRVFSTSVRVRHLLFSRAHATAGSGSGLHSSSASSNNSRLPRVCMRTARVYYYYDTAGNVQRLFLLFCVRRTICIDITSCHSSSDGTPLLSVNSMTFKSSSIIMLSVPFA